MAQTKRISRTLDLPIDRVWEIVTSEVFLTTTEKMVDAGNTEIENGSREVEADGKVRAHAEIVRAEDEEEGVPELRTHQDSIISTVTGEVGQREFDLTSDLPLPGNIGKVETRYHFTEDVHVPGGGETDGSEGERVARTKVEAVVEVSCKLPFVGKKLEDNVIENSEKTVDNSLERIRRFS